jgi:hypothetical protein
MPYLNRLRETDIQTLEEQYQPRETALLLPDSNPRNRLEGQIRQNLEELQCLPAEQDHSDERQREQEQEQEQEQELELQEEDEQQRQTQHVQTGTPADHAVGKDVKEFVKTGRLRLSRPGIIAAFTTLADTTASNGVFKADQFPSWLKVSLDFATVLKGNTRLQDKKDFYKRRVCHILTAARDGLITEMLLISPFEAEKLYSSVKASRIVAMHIYAPRQNRMYAPTDDLSLHVIPESARNRRLPPRLRMELNLFAGQLYFDSFKEYTDVCTYLGIAWNNSFANADADGFINRGENIVHGCLNAETSPIAFLKSFITNVRCFGGNIDKTHVGKMLSGEFLTESDFAARPKRAREDNLAEEESLFVKRERVDGDDSDEHQIQVEGRVDVKAEPELDVDMTIDD